MDKNFFKNKSLLLTGGSGSFGKAFVNYLLKNKSDLLDKMYKGKAQLKISKEDLSNIVIN